MHILGSPRPLVDPSLLPTSDRGNVRNQVQVPPRLPCCFSLHHRLSGVRAA